jgi:hypothetical protein
MTPDRRNARPFARAHHNVANRPARDPGQRRALGQEHRPTEPTRPTVAQIVHQRLANIVRQRQHVLPGALPADHDLRRPPVDIIELQPGDLASTQPQPGQQQHDRVVATTDRRRAIAAIQQPLHLVGSKPAREILRPASDRRHRRRQRLRDQPQHMQEPQQSPKRGHHRQGRPIRPPARLAQHEHVDLGARQAGQIILKPLRALLQEQARDPLIQPHRPGRHPTLHKQIAAKLPNQPLHR